MSVFWKALAKASCFLDLNLDLERCFYYYKEFIMVLFLINTNTLIKKSLN